MLLFLLLLDYVVLMVSFAIQFLGCRQSTVCAGIVIVVVVVVVISIRPGAYFACVVANLSSLVISPRKKYTSGKLW